MSSVISIISPPKKTKKSKKKKNQASASQVSRVVINPSKPVTNSSSFISGPPRMRDIVVDGKRGTNIAQTELIVLSSAANTTAFTVTQRFSLNPGLPSSFPWGSRTGSNFQEYRVKKFKAKIITDAPTSERGAYFLVPSYDSYDAPPANEIQAGAFSGMVTSPVYQSSEINFDIRSAMAPGNRKFIRRSGKAGDLRNYDFGQFFLCHKSVASANVAYTLLFEYDIDVFSAQIEPTGATLTALRQASIYTNNGNEDLPTGAETAVALSNVVDGLGFGSLTAGTCIPPEGVFKITTQGEVTLSTNVDLALSVIFEKNGTIISQLDFRAPDLGLGGLPPRVLYNLFDVIPFNGTDTFSVKLIATHTSGTATNLATIGSTPALLVELIG